MRPPRGESGRLLELQFVYAFVFIGAALSFAFHSPLKGFGLAFALLAAFIAGLIGLSYAASAVHAALEREPLRSFLASRRGILLRAAALAALAAVAAGVLVFARSR